MFLSCADVYNIRQCFYFQKFLTFLHFRGMMPYKWINIHVLVMGESHDKDGSAKVMLEDWIGWIQVGQKHGFTYVCTFCR